jgi:hypothetical protein
MFYFSSGSLKKITLRSSLFNKAACLSQSDINDSETNNEVRIRQTSREDPLIVTVSHIDVLQNGISLSLDDGADCITNAELDDSQWGRLDPSLLNKLDQRLQFTTANTNKNLKIGSVILIHQYVIKHLTQANQVLNIVDFTIIGESRRVCDADQVITPSQALEIIADERKLEHTELISVNAEIKLRADQPKIELDNEASNDTLTSKFAPSHHIIDLSVEIKSKWSILVRLLKKGPISYDKSFCRLLFADLTGKIEAVAFREKIKKHGLEKMEEGQIYRISNGCIALNRNPLYKAWTAVASVKYDLHIEKAIQFELIDERTEHRLCKTLANVRYTVDFDNKERSQPTTAKIETTILQPAINRHVEYKPENPNKVYPLDQISLLQNETKLNIIAIIENIGELEIMEARSYSNNSLQVRPISITDTTNVSVVCRFYGKEALKFNHKIGDILLIGKAVAKLFKKQIIICIYRETIVNVLNESSSLEAYKTLKQWWEERQQKNDEYQPTSKKQKI